MTSENSADIFKATKQKMSSATKADKRAADVAAWMFNVVTSVGIIMVNKALMGTYGFTFGMFFITILFINILL